MNKKTLATFIAGPALLLLTMVLLFAKTAFLLGRPVWIFGMSFSTLLSAGITCLAIKELFSREDALRHDFSVKEKEAADMRCVLEETHALYRGRIDRLEQEIFSTEQEVTSSQSEAEEMKIGYEKLYEEMGQAKAKASSFQTSLEDALDELRKLRQIQYIEQETEKHVPRDIVQRHGQLREQFDEKSMILEQTRRRLFALEGNLIAFKKQRGDELLNDLEDHQSLVDALKEIEEENAQLEREIALLEEVVSNLLAPKKKTSPAAKKKVEQMLELQFDS